MSEEALKIQNARTDIVQIESEKCEKAADNTTQQNIEIPPNVLQILKEATFSDAGNAERFLAFFDDKYIVIDKEWYMWTDKRWKKVDVIQLYQDLIYVLRISRKMYDFDKTNDSKVAVRSLINAENEPKLRAALHIAAAQQCVESEKVNANPWLLNTNNCTIDLRLENERMYDYERNDYITQIARAEYDPAADCTLWEKFVSEVFTDNEVRKYIQKFFGYCLTSLTCEHKLLILTGDGRNGKSTFVNAIAYALGDYANTIDPEILLRSRNEFDGRPTPYIAALQHKRLTVASETQAGRTLNDALIKNITSDDKITARNLHRDPIEFMPSHKLVLMTNYVPEISNIDDSALKSRLIIVPCNSHFEKLDHTLPERLKEKENLSAILNWLLEGCENYQNEGLEDVPTAIQDMLSSYYEKNDELGQFITERCIVNKNEFVKLTDLVKEYNFWRTENGYKAIKSKTVREALERRGFLYKVVCDKRSGRHSIRAILGLTVFSEGSEAENEKSAYMLTKAYKKQ